MNYYGAGTGTGKVPYIQKTASSIQNSDLMGATSNGLQVEIDKEHWILSRKQSMSNDFIRCGSSGKIEIKDDEDRNPVGQCLKDSTSCNNISILKIGGNCGRHIILAACFLYIHCNCNKACSFHWLDLCTCDSSTWGRRSHAQAQFHKSTGAQLCQIDGLCYNLPSPGHH